MNSECAELVYYVISRDFQSLFFPIDLRLLKFAATSITYCTNMTMVVNELFNFCQSTNNIVIRVGPMNIIVYSVFLKNQ